MQPTFKLFANDKEVTEQFAQHLIRLTIRDNRGMESDSLQIEIDDTKAHISLPRRGVKLAIYLGYVGHYLHYKGTFVVDEVAHDGPPDKLIISAKPADLLNGELKASKTRSWHDRTLGGIIKTVAQEHSLKPAISADLQSIKIPHIDQTEESDLHFLTRLARDYDAITKPANGSLLFTKRGASESASGQPLPVVDILRTDTNRHHWTQKGRQEYDGIRAYWQDKGKIERTGEYIGSKQGKLKTLKGTFASKEEAQAAARAESQRLKRDSETLELTLKHGLPELMAEVIIVPQGFRPYIDKSWVATEVTHTLSASSGLNTQVRCETPL